MMHWLWVGLVGLVVGALAKLVMGGQGPSGCLLTALLGVLGGVFGSWLGQQLHIYRMGEPAGFVGSLIGAVLILAIWGAISRRS